MALSGSTIAQVNLISPILTCITIVSPSWLHQMLEIPKNSGPRKFKRQPDFASCPQIPDDSSLRDLLLFKDLSVCALSFSMIMLPTISVPSLRIKALDTITSTFDKQLMQT